MSKPWPLLIAATALAWAGPGLGDELPAGEPVQAHGMTLKGIYLQAVKMAPALPGQQAGAADIHLELDAAALPGNAHGFAEGAWISYLAVDYRLAKEGSTWSAAGPLHPMVASDGPHYGANVALDGPGRYTLVFDIRPPSTNGFLRHTDRETAVAEWWKPFAYRGSFVFMGTGKKGGY